MEQEENIEKEDIEEKVEEKSQDQPQDGELKKKVVSGAFWRFGERFLAQGIGFIISIFLARMLSPDDYGAVALVIIFVNIADVFLSSGFSIALVRKKELDDEDLSSVFYLNLAISLFLYAIIFFTSPLVEKLFAVEGLTWLLRIIALKLPISALNTIQIAIVTSRMQFKMFFFATLGGTLASGVVGIAMAYNGFGAWSLIAQQLTNLVIDSLILFIILRWRPRWIFSMSRIKEMAPFSLRNMGTDLIGQIFNYLNSFVIGIKYTTEDLAYYSKGQQLPTLINSTVSQTLTSVMFPAIVRVSDEVSRVKAVIRKSTKTLSFIIVPMMVGLAMVSQELVIFLYTEKWAGMTIYMQLMCLSVMFDVIGAFDITTLKAIGKTKATLILEFIKKPICLAVIVISMFYGVLPIAIAATAYSLFANLVNSTALYKYVGYSVWEKLYDCLFPLVASIIMGGAIFAIKYIPIHNTAILFIKVGAGIIIYFLICVITKNKTFKELMDVVLGMVFRKRKKASN